MARALRCPELWRQRRLHRGARAAPESPGQDAGLRGGLPTPKLSAGWRRGWRPPLTLQLHLLQALVQGRTGRGRGVPLRSGPVVRRSPLRCGLVGLLGRGRQAGVSVSLLLLCSFIFSLLLYFTNEGNHSVLVCLCLAYFTEHHTLQLHACCCK